MARKHYVFHVGRLILAFALIAMGCFIYMNGVHVYDKYLHAVRKMFLPDSYGSQTALSTQITYDQLNQYLIKFDGILFVLSGLLIAFNKRKVGALLLFIALAFVLATKDNPFIKSNLKSIQNEQNQRTMDFIKHISLLGAAFLLAVH